MLDDSPNALLDSVLGKLNDALSRGDIDTAVGLFRSDCYWRDLVPSPGTSARWRAATRCATC